MSEEPFFRTTGLFELFNRPRKPLTGAWPLRLPTDDALQLAVAQPLRSGQKLRGLSAQLCDHLRELTRRRRTNRARDYVGPFMPSERLIVTHVVEAAWSL